MTKIPKISVIIPFYNGEKYVEKAIKSVLNQTFKNFEIIIVDDGSPDKEGGKVIIDLMKIDKRIKYFRKKNGGVSSARNYGIRKARGKFIALLDQDDLWMPEKLEGQIKLFDDEDVGLVYCNGFWIDEFTGFNYKTFTKKEMPRGNIFAELLKGNFIFVSSVVIRKSALMSLSRDKWSDEKIGMVEDYDLFLRISHDCKADYSDKILFGYRKHPLNFTSNNYDSAIYESEYLIKKYNELWSDLNEKYGKEVKLFMAKIEYHKGIYNWQIGNKSKAREYFANGFFADKRLILLYFLTIFNYKTFEFCSGLYRKITNN